MVVVVVMVVGEVVVLFCFLIGSSAALGWRKKWKEQKGEVVSFEDVFRKGEKEPTTNNTRSFCVSCRAQNGAAAKCGHPLTGTNITMLLPFNKI